MQLNIHSLLIQCIVLCIVQFGFVALKALVGDGVEVVGKNDFGFVVSIMYVGAKDVQLEENHICTGSLVSKRDVLTAAHCLVYQRQDCIQIIVGSTDLRNGDKYFPEWWITFGSWAEEKDQLHLFSLIDIGIIRLTKDVPDTINLPSISADWKILLPGLDVKSVGWGVKTDGRVPRFLESATLTILSKRECESRIEKLDGHKADIHYRFICTVAFPPALLTSGDSGSPILFNNTIIAIGLKTCPLPEQPFHKGKVNIHLIINYYKDFIMDIKDNF